MQQKAPHMARSWQQQKPSLLISTGEDYLLNLGEHSTCMSSCRFVNRNQRLRCYTEDNVGTVRSLQNKNLSRSSGSLIDLFNIKCTPHWFTVFPIEIAILDCFVFPMPLGMLLSGLWLSNWLGNLAYKCQYFMPLHIQKR